MPDSTSTSTTVIAIVIIIIIVVVLIIFWFFSGRHPVQSASVQTRSVDPLCQSVTAPSGFTGTQVPNKNQITFTWNPRKSGDLIQYRIYEAILPGVVKSVHDRTFDAGTGTTFTVDNLRDGTTYHYVITAIVACEGVEAESNVSSEVDITVNCPAPPPVITSMTLDTPCPSAKVKAEVTIIPTADKYRFYYGTNPAITSFDSSTYDGLVETNLQDALIDASSLCGGGTLYVVATQLDPDCGQSGDSNIGMILIP